MKERIVLQLKESCPWQDSVLWFDSIDSTNTKAKSLAAQGAAHGTVLIADHQTGGRGRRGRSFHSPAGTGIYMSVILRPHCNPAELMHLTCAAAVAICDAVEKLTGCKPMLLGPGIKTGMNILIDNPAQLGADLLAGCVGAAALYPLPCLVIDLGTASKISVVDKNGAFCGCTIAPGIGISLEALSAKTSQLPSISLKTPARAIGKNTVDSMQSGTVFGFAAMIDGVCEKLEEELGDKIMTTVATGGLAKDLIKSCKRDIIYNGDLVLYGLKVLYEKNRK